MLYIVGSDQKGSEHTGSDFSLMLHINGLEGSYCPRDHIPSLSTMQLLRGLSLCIISLSSRGQPVSTEPSHSPGGASLLITQIVIIPKWRFSAAILPTHLTKCSLTFDPETCFCFSSYKELCWQSLQIHQCSKKLTKPKFSELITSKSKVWRFSKITTHPIMSREVGVQKAGQFSIGLAVY